MKEYDIVGTSTKELISNPNDKKPCVVFRGNVNSWQEWLKLKKKGYTDIDGDFDCQNEGLEDLKGCPMSVSGYFNCVRNNLKSLSGITQKIGGTFSCSENKLESLEFCPESVGFNFYCSDNELISLEFCPKLIKGDFACSNNKLEFLNHCPDFIDGDFDFSGNKIKKLDVDHFPKEIKGSVCLNDNVDISTGYHQMYGKNLIEQLVEEKECEELIQISKVLKEGREQKSFKL